MESPLGAFGSRANLVGGCLEAGAWRRWPARTTGSRMPPSSGQLVLEGWGSKGRSQLLGWESSSGRTQVWQTPAWTELLAGWVAQVLLTGLDVLGQVSAFPPSHHHPSTSPAEPGFLFLSPYRGWLQPFRPRGQSPQWGPQMASSILTVLLLLGTDPRVMGGRY